MNAAQAEALVREVCTLRHMAWKTEQTYVGWVLRYCKFLASNGARFPTSEKRMEAFLSGLAHVDVAASTQNQAFNAILFLYRECLKQPLAGVDALRARRPSFVRHAPSVADVAALLREVQDCNGYPTRLLVQLLYGCGLRVSEPVALRVRDLDLANSRMTIRQAKGGKDRVVSVPCSLAADLARQVEAARLVWQVDVRNGVPVKLPHQLARKYPRAAFAWGWAWVFPLRTISRDPRSGEIVRWHCLDQSVQRAVRAAADRCGLAGTISPHHLRHAYATHAMRGGANVRDVQEVMGHASLETTMGYLHAEAGRVQSPLESLMLAAGGISSQ